MADGLYGTLMPVGHPDWPSNAHEGIELMYLNKCPVCCKQLFCSDLKGGLLITVDVSRAERKAHAQNYPHGEWRCEAIQLCSSAAADNDAQVPVPVGQPAAIDAAPAAIDPPVAAYAHDTAVTAVPAADEAHAVVQVPESLIIDAQTERKSPPAVRLPTSKPTRTLKDDGAIRRTPPPPEAADVNSIAPWRSFPTGCNFAHCCTPSDRYTEVRPCGCGQMHHHMCSIQAGCELLNSLCATCLDVQVFEEEATGATSANAAELNNNNGGGGALHAGAVSGVASADAVDAAPSLAATLPPAAQGAHVTELPPEEAAEAIRRCAP